jgi:5-carboxymethyl-2-hydroxymuconate isomerase
MPHIIVEYSNNLPDENWDIDDLLQVLVESALATSLFPASGMRARAIRCDNYHLGGGAPENGFLNISMRVGKGRSEAERQVAGEAIFAAAKDALARLTASRPVLLSFELRELDDVKFNYRTN